MVRLYIPPPSSTHRQFTGGSGFFLLLRQVLAQVQARQAVAWHQQQGLQVLQQRQ